MALSDKQIGVLKGMVAAALVTFIGFGFALFGLFSAPAFDLMFAERLRLALVCDAFVLAPLALSIGLLARHRFFTPEDIDGSGLTKGTQRASVLQAILQNTLEQTALAIGTHLVWAASMPASWFGAIPAAVAMFVIGRIAFSIGYSRGAPARAFGFALTFYPTLLMLFSALLYLALTVST